MATRFKDNSKKAADWHGQQGTITSWEVMSKLRLEFGALWRRGSCHYCVVEWYREVPHVVPGEQETATRGLAGSWLPNSCLLGC